MATAPRSRAATEFYYLWKGAQMDTCEILKQPCLYTKSMVILHGHRRLRSPVCPGCIFMHSAAGVMDLAEHITLSEDDEEPDSEAE